MKKMLVVCLFCFAACPAFSQKVDSIYFHLYTDSLKKGQHNYINVDAKMSNGRWTPLSSKELELSCSAAKFEGNQLIIPEDFKPARVSIKAVLKTNPAIWIEKTIWIKTITDPELPSLEELDKQKKKNRKD